MTPAQDSPFATGASPFPEFSPVADNAGFSPVAGGFSPIADDAVDLGGGGGAGVDKYSPTSPTYSCVAFIRKFWPSVAYPRHARLDRRFDMCRCTLGSRAQADVAVVLADEPVVLVRAGQLTHHACTSACGVSLLTTRAICLSSLPGLRLHRTHQRAHRTALPARRTRKSTGRTHDA